MEPQTLRSFEWRSEDNTAETSQVSVEDRSPVLEVELIIEDENWLQLSDDFEFIKEAAFLALSQKMHPAAELQQQQQSVKSAMKSPQRLAVIMLSDNSTIRELNKTYRGKDKATNVLSFPANLSFPTNENDFEMTSHDDELEAQHIGDVILAYEYVENEAKTEQKPLKTHISHLVIHGVLHLLGYDHETTEEANTMESLELALMKQLGYPDPYAPEIT